MTLQIRQISAKKKIQNFVETERGPFTSVDVQRYTGVNISTIRKQLCVLTKEEKIKVLRVEKGRKIYVRRGIRNKAGPGFQQEHVEMFINTINTHKCSSLKQIAYLTGYSKQLCYLYIEAMASAGVVTFDGIYRVCDPSRIRTVGLSVQKYILADLRRRAFKQHSCQMSLINVLKRIVKNKEKANRMNWIDRWLM